MCGVAPDVVKGWGRVWLMATPRIEEKRNAIPFLRNSHPYVNHLQALYPVLHNIIDARNELHLKWLKWCGFRITQTVENFGPEGRTFHAFIRTR